MRRTRPPRLGLGLLLAFTLLDSSAARAQTVPTGYQEYHVVGHEQHVLDFMETATGADFPDGTDSIVSMTASADGQVVRYDHWEDGFEVDILNPVQPTTLVFGDGDLANGSATDYTNDPRVTGDSIFRGTNLDLNSDQTSGPALRQYVPLVPTRDPADVRFDGGDRIYSSGGPLSLVHVQGPFGFPFIGGASEILSKEAVGELLAFTITIGEDTFTDYGGDDTPGEPFEAVALNLVSFEDGTSVTIENPQGDEVNFVLNKGQHYSSLGWIDTDDSVAAGITINEGSEVRSSAPLAGVIFTIGPNNYTSRFFPILPDRMHSTDFTIAAPGIDTAAMGNTPTNVYLFNPNSDDITVQATDTDGSASFVIPGRGSVAYSDATAMNRMVPTGSTTRLLSDRDFWGLVAYDHQSGGVDWGCSLIATEYLTSYYSIAFAPGTLDPATDHANRAARGCDGVTPCDSLNGAPIFVGAVSNRTRVQVDLDGDGNWDEIDTNADDVLDPAPLPDNTYLIDALQTLKIYDPSDYDNAGTQVRANKPVNLAYGEDPDTAAGGDAVRDAGYTVYPYHQSFLDKVFFLEQEASPSSVPTTGGRITVTMRLSSGRFAPLTSIIVSDDLAPELAYVPGSTLVTYPDGSTDTTDPAVTGTPAAGERLDWTLSPNQMLVDEELVIQFEADLPGSAPVDSYSFHARSTGFLDGSQFSPEDTSFVLKSNLQVVATAVELEAGTSELINNTISIVNTGPLETNSELGFSIPAGTSYEAGSANLGGTFDSGQNAVVWPIGDLPTGASGPFTFQLRVNPGSEAGQVVGGPATLDSDVTPGLVSNTTATTVVAPVLVGSKSGPAAVLPGDAGEFLLQVRNDGTRPATNVLLVDPLPSNVTYVAESMEHRIDGGAWVPLTDANGDDEGEAFPDRLELLLANLPVGSELEMRFRFSVDGGEPAGSFINNQATFSSFEVVEAVTNLSQVLVDLDTDMDGLADRTEDDLGTDPTIADTDGDGLDDGQEVLVESTDPFDRDSDDDGLSDGEEVTTTTTDPLDADSDDDGLQDGTELGRSSGVA
ncbi:MAG: DUF11 domain-containing protein, partial [Acidobacteriota bacterium]